MTNPFHVKEHTIPASHIREYPRATSSSQDDSLLLHIKQYIPKNNPNPRQGDMTVIGAHANGFPKEMYEPLFEDFLHEVEKKGLRVRAIWIADAAWQGRSGVLNQDKLGNDPSWLDHSRDVLHMINTFRMPRPLVGMGHSFGACSLVRTSLMHSRLFDSLVLIDPVISRFSSTQAGNATTPAALSVRRRDVWPSRDAAAMAFRKSPWYQSWDDRVLNRWIEFGLRKLDSRKSSDNEVTLSTNKHQEVFTFLRPSWPAYDAQGKFVIRPECAPDLDPEFDTKHPTWPFYRPEPSITSAMLPNLRPSVFYIFGGRSELSDKTLRDDKMANTGVGIGGSGGAALGRVKQVTYDDCGHLVPMQAPQRCASSAAEWMAGEAEVWKQKESEYQEWTRLPKEEKTMVSETYRRWLGEGGFSDSKKEKAKM